MPDKWVARAGRIEQVGDAGSLTAQLAAMRKQMESAGKPADKIQVVLSPGRNVKYEHLIDVYQAALRAEFTKISFAAAH
jgi:biopolymer transport protein ExbD